ncbi:hypothetical protein AAKU64_004141 [Undibacterium sp. GrIS 1.8]|uniref:hypothetical protein n=1 Tax=unclassified Undibacterium TaxID=2630295 RepID=UPI003391C85A
MPDDKKPIVFTDGTGIQNSSPASPEDLAKWQKQRTSEIANLNSTIKINGTLQQFNTRGMIHHVPGKMTAEEQKKRYDDAKAAIAAARKHIPKLRDYEEYLEYLKTNPSKLNKVLAELETSNPEAWIKLQKIPQFQSLGKGMSLAGGAGNTAIGAVVGALGSLLQGKAPTGIPTAWAENTIKDMMKRDGFGTYSKALGSGSSTLPAPKEEYFSNSLYGEHRKVEVPRLEKEYGKAAAASKLAIRGITSAVGVAVTRVATPLLDTGIALLDTEKHGAITDASIEFKLQDAWGSGRLTDDQYITAHNLMSQRKYKEMQDYLNTIAGHK